LIGPSIISHLIFCSLQGPNKNVSTDFDFETNLEEFKKVSLDPTAKLTSESSKTKVPQSTYTPPDTKVYNKDDFFDSISCDVLDRQRGIDTRLRGSQERSLNTETFGATSLSHSLNRNNMGGRGRGGEGRNRGGRGRGPSHGRRVNTTPSSSSSLHQDTKENQRSNQSQGNHRTKSKNTALNAHPTASA
jgi:hypothetical protein